MVSRQELFSVVSTTLTNLLPSEVDVVAQFTDIVSDMPQVVIVNPKKDRITATFDGDNRSGYINIEIYTKTALEQRTLTDLIENVLYTTEFNLTNVNIVSSDATPFLVGDEQANFIVLTMEFGDYNIG